MGTNGVVETARLRAAEKMGDERTWAAAVALGGLHEIGRWTAVRGTKEARATAALLEAGRPLTTDEIGAAVGIGDPKETRVLLGNRKAFRKTSKTRWALTAWKLPRYEGVVREAERRIKAGGGRVERSELIRDLEATTEAARSTIARYLAARRFHTADGWVELAGRDGRSRSNIEEEADGIDGTGTRTAYGRDRDARRARSASTCTGSATQSRSTRGWDRNGRRRSRSSNRRSAASSP